MFKKLISLFLSFTLIFTQPLFAQGVAQFNLGSYLSTVGQSIATDRFRPLHMRYFSYDPKVDNFQLLLDKGDNKDIKETELEEKTKVLMEYFQIGLSLPNDKFWVNLRPDAQDEMIDPELEKTDMGKIMLEADLQLKRDTAQATSPQTPEGKAYWDKLYKKAGELFGTENITIPTITRPWIVPGEVILRQGEDSAYIFKANMKVMLEHDYLVSSGGSRTAPTYQQYAFSDPRMKELNEYSSQLIRELIIPKLTKEVNSSKRYASLRQVFFSLVMARWFKDTFSPQSTVHSPQNNNSYVKLIDSHNLTNLTSKEAWDKVYYFNEYKKSFEQGEYNLKENITTPTGQVIRSYVSGGMSLMGYVKRGIEYVKITVPAMYTAGKKALLPIVFSAGFVTAVDVAVQNDNVDAKEYSISVGEEYEPLTYKKAKESFYDQITDMIRKKFSYGLISSILAVEANQARMTSYKIGDFTIEITEKERNQCEVVINVENKEYVISYKLVNGEKEEIKLEAARFKGEPISGRDGLYNSINYRDGIKLDVEKALKGLQDYLDENYAYERIMMALLQEQKVAFNSIDQLWSKYSTNTEAVGFSVSESNRRDTMINYVYIRKETNNSYSVEVFLEGGIEGAKPGASSHKIEFYHDGEIRVNPFSPDTKELERPYLNEILVRILKEICLGKIGDTNIIKKGTSPEPEEPGPQGRGAESDTPFDKSEGHEIIPPEPEEPRPQEIGAKKSDKLKPKTTSSPSLTSDQIEAEIKDIRNYYINPPHDSVEALVKKFRTWRDIGEKQRWLPNSSNGINGLSEGYKKLMNDLQEEKFYKDDQAKYRFGLIVESINSVMSGLGYNYSWRIENDGSINQFQYSKKPQTSKEWKENIEAWTKIIENYTETIRNFKKKVMASRLLPDDEKTEVIFDSEQVLHILNDIVARRLNILKEAVAGASSAVSLNPEKQSNSSPVGGIDFRQMNYLVQPMGGFKDLQFGLPTLTISALERVDLDKELIALRNMVKAGMVPSGERVKEYLAACFQKGKIEERQDDLLVCLAEIYRLAEEENIETSPELRESLVIVDTGKFVLLPNNQKVGLS